MRILFVSAEYPPDPGGIGDYTQQLAQSLAAQQQTVSVLTLHAQQWQLHAVGAASDVAPVTVLGAGKNWGWTMGEAVDAAIGQMHPDLVHIQYQTGAYGLHPAINLLPWRLRQRKVRPRVAVTFHDLLEPYLFPKAGPLRRWISNRLAADSDVVVTTNMVDRDQLRQRLPNTPISLIPIGSNIEPRLPSAYSREAWRAELGVRPDEVLISFFGLVGPSKGLDLLVDALREADLRWRLLLIGGAATAPQDREHAATVAAQIANAGLNSQVIRTGHIPPTDVSACLRASDLVALPFRDGASFRRGSLLAALAHGCAVITTTPTDADTASHLIDEQHVVLAPPNNVEALRRAIERLARDGALRTALGAHASDLAEGFRWPSIAAEHVRVYTQS